MTARLQANHMRFTRFARRSCLYPDAPNEHYFCVAFPPAVLVLVIAEIITHRYKIHNFTRRLFTSIEFREKRRTRHRIFGIIDHFARVRCVHGNPFRAW